MEHPPNQTAKHFQTSTFKRLHIRMSIWNRISFGLYDFSKDNQQTTIKDYFISKNGFFLLNLKTDQIYEVNKFGINSWTEELKKIAINIEKKEISDKNNGKDISDSLWAQIRPQFMYTLSEGETIRFGKQRLIVKSIKLKTSFQKSSKTSISNLLESDKQKYLLTSNSASKVKENDYIIENQKSFDCNSVCRICLEPNTNDNPFIDICKCSKHMPTHLECTRKWIEKKGTKQRNPSIIFCNLQEIKCEVCQEEYPISVQFKDKTISLLNFNFNPERPHVYFDVCCVITGKTKGFLIIYFDLNDKTITIGRTNSNDVCFNDPSISREHAILSMNEKGLKVSDRSSKYGTLVKVDTFKYKTNGEKAYIQIDKFLFEIHSFTGKKCSCKIYHSIKLQKDPFRSIPELEKNDFQPKIPEQNDNVFKTIKDKPSSMPNLFVKTLQTPTKIVIKNDFVENFPLKTFETKKSAVISNDFMKFDRQITNVGINDSNYKTSNILSNHPINDVSQKYSSVNSIPKKVSMFQIIREKIANEQNEKKNKVQNVNTNFPSHVLKVRNEEMFFQITAPVPFSEEQKIDNKKKSDNPFLESLNAPIESGVLRKTLSHRLSTSNLLRSIDNSLRKESPRVTFSSSNNFKNKECDFYGFGRNESQMDSIVFNESDHLNYRFN